ncbi:radical S-adenosyl methionine domain-containing protein 1, mitochondrial isoform X2 [Spea bombifrons]|uniref:radical S-adenosyl methionine domain-containing protein 1, mitochondrial isoform X2 n=1 Tax=Spea bombifrons TaxID=233779 RepID=UPI00234901F1|nr:radical S-adenosyl methionine domain-containing protein 1, mitochondrial isoform X2 [Spea bombifrons]
MKMRILYSKIPLLLKRAEGKSIFVFTRRLAKRYLHTEEAALYIHWPYCEKRCIYCNFNKYVQHSNNEDVIQACLLKEARTLIKLSQVSRISSVYFGGGTPSLASPHTIGAILEVISQSSLLPLNAEVTLEVNPTSIHKSRLQQFREVGVNRISIGVQSLDDFELHLLGRTHSAFDAQQTIEEACRLFPGYTSVDVMFGLPWQSLTSWCSTLRRLLAQCDDHVSLYQLTVERGTGLFKLIQSGCLSVPDQEQTAQMYDCARKMLHEAGFQQYEVSNFARNGKISKHNLSYWLGKQYIGIGPGAHGRFVARANGGTRRQARIQTLEPDPWMMEVIQHGHGTRKVIEQSHLDVLLEVLALGLRTDIGITHESWQQHSPFLGLQHIFDASDELRELRQQEFFLLDESSS